MLNETGSSSPSQLFRSNWPTVFVVELVVISIINGFTILTFARNRHLRKRTTYLIINLTIADLFVGTVTVPMHIYHTMTFEPGSGFGWRKFVVMFLKEGFRVCSLLNLALLSLERLHATLFPFRHCLMSEWFYFKAVVCIWFVAAIPASVSAAFFLIAPQASQYVWALLKMAVLFTVIVSCVVIGLNVKRKVPPYSVSFLSDDTAPNEYVKRKVPPYSFGAVSSDRKLTVTLVIVTVVSAVVFFPTLIYNFLQISTILSGFSAEAKFDILQSMLFFCYFRSFVNTLVHTLRMKEVRKDARVGCGPANQ